MYMNSSSAAQGDRPLVSIHKTANIENGYLNGRYGGIPFLSNLKDLHW